MQNDLTVDLVTKSMRELARVGIKSFTERFRGSGAENIVQYINADAQSINFQLSEGNIKKKNVKFHPLPASDGGFYLAFFRPMIIQEGGLAEIRVDLLLVTEGNNKKTVGFRFERGLKENDTHAYFHVQLTRSFENGPETDWPDFVPQSYPAFPTGSRSTGDIWLAVLVSLYGLSHKDDLGLTSVLAMVDNDLKTDFKETLLPRAKDMFPLTH